MTVHPNDHHLVDLDEHDNLDLVDLDDDGFDGGFEADPYDSHAEGVPFAHHVITPALLAGLSGAPLHACRTFHDALFHRLDGVGGFDGIVATPAVVIGPAASEKSAAALAWIREHPAPDAAAMFDAHLAAGYEPVDAADHVIHTVNTHSLAFASAMGTNPSMTSASSPALSEALYVVMRAQGSNDVQHVDTLTDVALSLLAVMSGECRLDGGAEVIDTGELLEAARRSADSE